MERCACSYGAFNLDLACVLLDDSVGDGESQPGAAPVARLRHGFGGEERIVDAFHVLWSNSAAAVGNHGLHMPIHKRGDAQIAATGHGFFGIEQQVKKDLLQLTRVAVDSRESIGKFEIDVDLCGLELMLEQRERIADDLVEIPCK